MPTDLVKLIQADIDTIDAADQARAAWLERVQVERDSHSKLGPVLRALRAQVLAQFGDTQSVGSTLADFGYTPLKIAERSVADKATAADKARGTRKARHTMG